ncbi:MAG TPA: class I tRNA ligase family protein, partial [Micromonosporaceae bacterium]|nr:class I tRNA ligase family protein [Micromonosporaceae bacterium]
MSEAADTAAAAEIPPFRYTAAMAGEIEERWQAYWEQNETFRAADPAGPFAEPDHPRADAEKLYVADMFPYPSGDGLHVGHPLGYIGTDCYTRFQRMAGYNVLHPMGFDAFGLPAEQYAVQTGTHPRTTTEANIVRFRQQLKRLGLAYDNRRSVETIDPDYYRWTQWIFLQIFNSWYDGSADGGAGRARPIDELAAEFAAGRRPTPDGRPWSELSEVERRQAVDEHRLAYVSEAPVNWCPGLGTVLANEEVTAEGRSDRGNFPVFKRSLRQWKMRITAYADRLLADLDLLDWPEPIKLLQRNWIGRSVGAHIDFPTDAGPIRVFTTRPDTVFGATYMVLAPEHELVDALVGRGGWPEGTQPAWTGGAATPEEAVTAYRRAASRKNDVERQSEGKDKTGVFTGGWATNPVTSTRIPVFVADYVLMGYGTGAIMAVPGQDERDWDFATAFDLPIVRTVQPPEGHDPDTAYPGEGPAINSSNDEVSLDGLGVAEAKARITTYLEERGLGEATVTYKLRDWLFSR